MDQEKEREEEEEEKAENVEMVGQDEGVGDHFFDGEEDDGQVDMAVVFEAMKHVPLPDFDYAESDDTSPAELEDFPAQAAGPRDSEHDPSKASIKGTAGTGGAGHVKKKGASRGRVPKRVKGPHNGKDSQETGSLKELVKVERSITATTATAAKVAAEVAPDVVTGGVVAESGPRPDFSLWTVEDDLLLKNAMEAGAAVEALAKGAMRFSRRCSVRELRERWRALLYDPEISAQAATRMVEAEAALSIVPPKPKTPNDRKKIQNLERKRRLHSIRTLYYKNRKKMATEKLMSITESQILDHREDGEDEVPDDVHGEAGGRSVLVPLDMMTLEAGDPNFIEGPLSPKGTPEFDDRTFTEMFSLLAAGGVGAVFGPLPGGSSLDTVEEEHKAGQENQSGFNSGQGKATNPPESSVFISVPTEGDAAVQGDLKCTARAVTSNEANVSIHDKLGPGEENLQFPAGQNPKQELLEENNNVIQLQSNNHAIYEDSATKDAGHVEGGCTTPSIGNFECVVAQVSSREGSPVEELLDSLPADTFLKSDYLGKANGEREAPSKVEEPASKTSVTTNLSIVRTESGLDVGNKELEFCIQTIDPPCSLLKEPVRVAVADRSETLEDIVSLTAACKNEDIEEEDCDPLQVQWKQRQLKGDGDVEGPHDGSLEEFYEGEVEGDSDGMLYDRHAKELDEGVGDDSHYRTDSEEALDLHNSSMLYSTGSEYVRRAAIDLVLMDPVFGPLICAYNTEDTEVPSIDEALTLPSVGSPLFTASELGDEEEIEDDDNFYYTSGEDEADMPGSPTDLQVYESESHDTLGVKVELGDIDSLQPTIGASKASIKIKVGRSVQMCGLRQEGENLWEPRTAAANPAISAGELFQSSIPPPLDGGTGPCDLHNNRLEEDAGSPRSDTDGGQHSRGSPSNSETSVPEYSGAQPGFHEAEVEGCTAELDPIAKQEAQAGAEGDAAELKTGGEASGHLQIEEEEPESETEMARFSDVETMIMNMDLDPGADDKFSALAESRRMYRQQRKALVRLEQGMEAAMQRILTKRKALAILYGHHLRFYMTKTQVSMGRMTQDNLVDIDLGKEGRANKVSRQQAFMKLKADGVFYLTNLGRRSLTVNNIAIGTGQRAILGSNCLIEVGGMRFIFEINKTLVKQ